MKLENFGYNNKLEKFRMNSNFKDFDIGRVVMEHKERYVVITEYGEVEAEITGNLRFSAKSREDYPAVGDWVTLTIFESSISIIHSVLPRFSIISRQAVGQFGGIQIIATNIDYALLVQAVDRDFSINRLERYLTICYSSHVKPIIVLTKIDLIEKCEIADIIERIQSRINNVPIFAFSNISLDGFEALKQIIEKGKTFCLIGSSGVGKSSLLNNLSNQLIMRTGAISHSTNKGRHITSHRELVLLENGGMLIDNPGMKEVGITDSAKGFETTFDKITNLSKNCRFRNCTHTTEISCSVIEAVLRGEIERSEYENYLRLEREKAHFESTLEEKRKKDKEFGKMVKRFKKSKNMQ